MTIKEAAWLATGLAIGFGTSIAMNPTQTSTDCNVYKVARVPVTAYVLKPPPNTTPPALCPPQPKCEPVAQPAPEETVIERPADKHRIKRRHHRRRWWRR